MTDDNKSTALVVDDDPTVIGLLAYILESASLRVLSARSGYEALEILTSEDVHVVLTDVSMNGMSGFELIEHIKLLDTPTEVIMITGYDSYDMVRRALRVSAYDYLSKPLHNTDEIISTVKRACDSSRLKRENKALVERLQASNSKINSANKRLTQLNSQLRKLATTDSLTQLYNRRFIDDWMLNHAFTSDSINIICSILLLDIDHFKRINDTYGHDSGDKVLKHLAAVLKEANDDKNLVGRYGGEEFIIVMPGTDTQDAMQAAERIRKKIEAASVTIDSKPISTTISVGISTIHLSTMNSREREITPAEAILSGRALATQADKALYAAKDMGRNVSVHYNNLSDPGVVTRRTA